MKMTYLLNKQQPDGTVQLEIATYDEWLGLVEANKLLPPSQRRYFIRDYIADGYELDCMVIEVSRQEYCTWNREHMAAERNRSTGKKFQHLSLDVKLFSADEGESLQDSLITANLMEDMVCERMLIENLRVSLAHWKPWANGLLDLYLQGQKKSCTAALAAKYGVSQQTARKYKRQFENFIKNFLSDVSF